MALEIRMIERRKKKTHFCFRYEMWPPYLLNSLFYNCLVKIKYLRLETHTHTHTSFSIENDFFHVHRHDAISYKAYLRFMFLIGIFILLKVPVKIFNAIQSNVIM